MEKITTVKCKMQAWGVATLLAGGMLLPFPNVALAAAGTSGKPAADTGTTATLSETEAARRSIQSAYNRMDAAAARKDARGALGNQTADYVSIDVKGIRASGEEMEATTAMSFSLAESVSGWTVVEKCVLQGNTATVTTCGGGMIIFRGVGKQKRSVLRITDCTRDTWVKHNGRWLISRSQALGGYVTENGKFVRRSDLRRR